MKRAFTLLELVIVVAIILGLAAFLYPAFHRPPKPNALRAACQSNLKQIGLGFLQYAQDYDERLPPARVTPTLGWADAIFPYIKSQEIFQCPAEKNHTSPVVSDYFYNRNLARVTQEKLLAPNLTLMAGDGTDNASTWNSWTGLPADAVTNPESPTQRHLYTGTYLFADGHVKSLKPTAISSASTLDASTLQATFAIK